MRINTNLILLEMARKNIKAKDLAAAAGLSPQSLSTILNRKTCYPRNAFKIAQALNLDENTIIIDNTQNNVNSDCLLVTDTPTVAT